MQTVTKVFASAIISELQSSDMYLTLKARLFDLKANLNGVRVTEAFLDEIVENEEKYMCIPLYADIRGLLANRTVGHMYNKRTGEFYSTQIGSFYRYEKEIDGDNVYLVGYARVMKRNKALCKALTDLFADNALKFSFELSCGVYEKLESGELLIDADEKNYFEGECIVTFPACEGAIALDLVAECLGKGDENMAKKATANSKKSMTPETETEVIVSEQVEVAETETEVSEDIQAETAQTETAEVETAEKIYVRETHYESDEVSAYNDTNGESVEQRTTTTTTVCTPVEIAEDCGKDDDADECDKDDDSDGCTKKDDKETAARSTKKDDAETAACCKKDKKTAEVDYTVEIAEIKDGIAALQKMLAEYIASSTAVTELVAEVEATTEGNETITAETDNAVVNPFMASISTSNKYSLLGSEEKQTNRKYRLLERE